MDAAAIDKTLFQVGLTRLFLHKGEPSAAIQLSDGRVCAGCEARLCWAVLCADGFLRLESLLQAKVMTSALTLQRVYRGFGGRKVARRRRRCLLKVQVRWLRALLHHRVLLCKSVGRAWQRQSVARMCLAIAETRRRRRTACAVRVQAIVRGRAARKRVKALLVRVVRCQSTVRRWLAGRRAREARRVRAARRITRRWWSILQLRKLRTTLRRVLVVQLRIRLYLARTRARREAHRALCNARATTIQRVARGHQARR